jgi:hypothetical protein
LTTLEPQALRDLIDALKREDWAKVAGIIDWRMQESPVEHAGMTGGTGGYKARRAIKEVAAQPVAGEQLDHHGDDQSIGEQALV